MKYSGVTGELCSWATGIQESRGIGRSTEVVRNFNREYFNSDWWT